MLKTTRLAVSMHAILLQMETPRLRKIARLANSWNRLLSAATMTFHPPTPLGAF